MQRFFDTPVQVMFSDPDNEGKWLVGIAHGDEIICACCGGIFEIDEIESIHTYKNWIDIVDAITGGEVPESLAYILHDELMEADALLEEEENFEANSKNLS